MSDSTPKPAPRRSPSQDEPESTQEAPAAADGAGEEAAGAHASEPTAGPGAARSALGILSVPLDLGSVPPAPSTPPAGWLADAPAAPVPPAAASDDPAAVPGEAAASAEIGYQPRGSVQEEPDAGPADVGSEAPAVSERRSRSEGPESATSLTSDRLVAKSPAAPVGGWRRWLYFATFGYVNVGDSDAVRMQRALEHRIAVRLGEKTRYVPVLSRKGGVGKTTVTTLLGMALADLREDRVIAMDANPDRGTLSDRNPGRASHTARQLVKDRFEVNSFAQLSNYTAREGSRLDVLASDADPMVAHAFNDADYRAVTDILGRYYSIVLTDSGTGMVHSVMQGTLEKADAVVLVSGGSVDEARLASETLSWLEAHGRDDLVRKAIVVVNVSAGSGTRVNVDEIEEHFRTRVGHVVRIPHDRHLAEGSQIEFAKLGAATREAAIELAGLVVDQLTD
ncbi:MinD-like ATPase involved in chromosome partitioning or flagellar assembly [Sinomonas atrocyanea]|uniref:MinD/ParA family ATP-binding protein n=1 Tax=Sinomonas atrocyanea TaxID=37927 RepID=UPI00278848E1|nr:MinD/ParA family protein [Sinomonas atrocyanea]MDQ0260081.1 MinD-like ATPase involved in chromosome partitioning or flagellar assembly [Sinomonas atrocyanea]